MLLCRLPAQFICLAFYQKEMALYVRARLDKPLRSFCPDTDLHPEFKVRLLLPCRRRRLRCCRRRRRRGRRPSPWMAVLQLLCWAVMPAAVVCPLAAGAVVQEGASLCRVCGNVPQHHAGRFVAGLLLYTAQQGMWCHHRKVLNCLSVCGNVPQHHAMPCWLVAQRGQRGSACSGVSEQGLL